MGQLREGTDIKEGIGIRIASNGDTLKLNHWVYMRDAGGMVDIIEKGDLQ